MLFRYAPDRKAERPGQHLRAFRGDLYAGFDRLYGERIGEIACWAHVRRTFFDIHAATGSATAREALDHVAALYAVEQDVRGRPPDERRRVRQARAGPLLDALRRWLDATGPKLSRRSDLAVAIRYALTRWPALVRYCDDGRLEIDSDGVRDLSGGQLSPERRRTRTAGHRRRRKNWLFAGSDQGGHRAASIYSLVEINKLNGIDPEAWLADTVARIADHPARRVADLLPWNYRPA